MRDTLMKVIPSQPSYHLLVPQPPPRTFAQLAPSNAPESPRSNEGNNTPRAPVIPLDRFHFAT